MNHHKYYPINDEAFFSNYYSRVSVLLNSFAHERKKFIISNNKSTIQTSIVALTFEIFSIALSVTGAQIDSTNKENTNVFHFLCSNLILSLSQSEHEVFRSIGDEIQQHYIYLQSKVNEKELDKYIEYSIEHGVLDKNKSYGNIPTITFEFLSNCIHVLASRLFNSFKWSCPDPRLVIDFAEIDIFRKSITPSSNDLINAATKLDGWCSPQKTNLLYHLTRTYKPKISVEIGIYNGKSIIPIAAGLKDNENGFVYGIETWSGIEATTYRTSIENDFWWMNIDFENIKKSFLQFIIDENLCNIIKIIESPSHICHSIFNQIDFLHIDGGHSTFGAAQDVINYVSKVPSGGIIVYDDINWPSTSAGLEILRDTCRLLHTVPAFGSTTEPGCAAFIKI